LLLKFILSPVQNINNYAWTGMYWVLQPPEYGLMEVN